MKIKTYHALLLMLSFSVEYSYGVNSDEYLPLGKTETCYKQAPKFQVAHAINRGWCMDYGKTFLEYKNSISLIEGIGESEEKQVRVLDLKEAYQVEDQNKRIYERNFLDEICKHLRAKAFYDGDVGNIVKDVKNDFIGRVNDLKKKSAKKSSKNPGMESAKKRILSHLQASFIALRTHNNEVSWCNIGDIIVVEVDSKVNAHLIEPSNENIKNSKVCFKDQVSTEVNRVEDHDMSNTLCLVVIPSGLQEILNDEGCEIVSYIQTEVKRILNTAEDSSNLAERIASFFVNKAVLSFNEKIENQESGKDDQQNVRRKDVTAFVILNTELCDKRISVMKNLKQAQEKKKDTENKQCSQPDSDMDNTQDSQGESAEPEQLPIQDTQELNDETFVQVQQPDSDMDNTQQDSQGAEHEQLPTQDLQELLANVPRSFSPDEIRNLCAGLWNDPKLNDSLRNNPKLNDINVMKIKKTAVENALVKQGMDRNLVQQELDELEKREQDAHDENDSNDQVEPQKQEDHVDGESGQARVEASDQDQNQSTQQSQEGFQQQPAKNKNFFSRAWTRVKNQFTHHLRRSLSVGAAILGLGSTLGYYFWHR